MYVLLDVFLPCIDTSFDGPLRLRIDRRNKGRKKLQKLNTVQSVDTEFFDITHLEFVNLIPYEQFRVFLLISELKMSTEDEEDECYKDSDNQCNRYGN